MACRKTREFRALEELRSAQDPCHRLSSIPRFGEKFIEISRFRLINVAPTNQQSLVSCVVDDVVVGEGKNLKGRLLGLVLKTVGRSVLTKAFENSVKAIEARKGAARAAGA